MALEELLMKTADDAAAMNALADRLNLAVDRILATIRGCGIEVRYLPTSDENLIMSYLHFSEGWVIYVTEICHHDRTLDHCTNWKATPRSMRLRCARHFPGFIMAIAAAVGAERRRLEQFEPDVKAVEELVDNARR